MKLTRAYKLPIFHNPTKWDVVRYTAAEYAHWLKYYTSRQLLQNFGTTKLSKFSTAGLGWIANIASHDARGRAKALVESSKTTGNKINVPEFTQFVCPGELQSAKKSVEHQHWIKVSGAFGTTTYLPCRLTKPVRRKLAAGWEFVSSKSIRHTRVKHVTTAGMFARQTGAVFVLNARNVGMLIMPTSMQQRTSLEKAHE